MCFLRKRFILTLARQGNIVRGQLLFKSHSSTISCANRARTRTLNTLTYQNGPQTEFDLGIN